MDFRLQASTSSLICIRNSAVCRMFASPRGTKLCEDFHATARTTAAAEVIAAFVTSSRSCDRGITRPGGRRAGQSKVRCIIVLDFSSRYIALHLLLQCYRQKPVFLLARQQYIGHSLVTARRLLSASTHSTRRPTACIAPCPPPLFLRVDMQQICKPCKSLLKIQRGIT